MYSVDDKRKDTIHMNVGYEKNFCELMSDNELGVYYIYLLVLDGVVIYVGKTKNILGRLSDYKCRFQKHKCHNPKLQEMFDNGKIKQVTFVIKDKANTQPEAIRLETQYIEKFRTTCLNKYDDDFSILTRKKISAASRKMWKDKATRKNIIDGISKKHTLTSPNGEIYEFPNSYETRDFLDKINMGLHPRDRKRIGYQMLESCGENKGWTMVIEGKRSPHKMICGILKTPHGKEISIIGKSDLVRVNRFHGFRLNVNRLLQVGEWKGFKFLTKGT